MTPEDQAGKEALEQFTKEANAWARTPEGRTHLKSFEEEDRLFMKRVNRRRLIAASCYLALVIVFVLVNVLWPHGSR